MKQEKIELLVSNTIRKSRLSSAITLVFVAAFIGAIAFLSRKVTTLNEQIGQKSVELIEKNNEIRRAESKLAQYKAANDHFQLATRHLLNRNYQQAIDSLDSFLAIIPNDPQGLHLLGYTQLRYALQLRDNANGNDATTETINKLFNSSEENLMLAAKLLPSSYWPLYNRILLLYYTDRKSEAIAELQSTLTGHPQITKLICDDGQFRKMRLDKDTAFEFTRIISSSAKETEISECWVTSQPKN